MLKPLTKISYTRLYYTSILLVVTVFTILALLMQSHFRESGDQQKAVSLAYNQAQLNAANFRVNLQQVRYLFERNVNQSRYSIEHINSVFIKIRKQLKPDYLAGNSDVYQSITMAYSAFYNASDQQKSEESASDSVRIMYDSSIELLESVLSNAYFLSQNSLLTDGLLLLIEQLVKDLKTYAQQDSSHHQEIRFLLQQNQHFLGINTQLLIDLKLLDSRAQLLDNLKKLRTGIDSIYARLETVNDLQENSLLEDINRTFHATNTVLTIYVTELPSAKELSQQELERLRESKMLILAIIMLLVAAIGMISIYSIQRIVQLRIESIASHITAIGGGNYELRSNSGNSDDVARLANTMNEVANTLQEKDLLIHEQLKLLAHSELELQEANKLLEYKVNERTQKLKLASRIIESLNEAVMITDTRNQILSVNPAYSLITGYQLCDVVGTIPEFMTINTLKKDVDEQLQQTGKWVGEYKNPCKNGKQCLVRISLILLFDEQNIPSHKVAIITDIAEQKRYEQQLEKFAYYDPLTQLPNRRLYRERIDYFCSIGERDGLKRALLFIDLDNFKSVNDSLGHEAGDVVLMTVSKRLKNVVKRKSDYISRLGGDEFTAVLDPIKSKQNIATIAAQIIREIEMPITIFGQHVKVGCSIGIAEYPQDGQNYTALNRCADLAMYKAKEKGKNTYVFYHKDLDTTTPEQLNMDIELSSALDKNQFVLHYQPKWNLKRGEVVGFEALIRWDHNGELVAPDHFIPLLETSRQIIEVGLWVIEQSMRQINEWQRLYHKVIPIAVNVSALQLTDPKFVQKVVALKNQFKISAGSLEFEITESLMMGCAEESARVQRALVAEGIAIAVDDFGTGYSSMLYLKHFPVKTLKIDRCFITDICHSIDSQAIVAAVLSIAEKLSLNVVAEGIETKEQLDTLKQLNEKNISISCQGFYFSPAVEVSAIDEIMCKPQKTLV